MGVGSALFLDTLVLDAEAFAISAVFTKASFAESVARSVTNAFDWFANTGDLVALGENTSTLAVAVVGTFSGNTGVVDASFFVSTSGVTDAADWFALVVLADLAVAGIAVCVGGAFLQDTLVVLAKFLVLAEGVTSASNFLASIGLLIANFWDTWVAISFDSAFNCSALWKTVLSALDGFTVGEALGWLESTVSVGDGFSAVTMTGTLSFNALVVVASLFGATVGRGNTSLWLALVLEAETFTGLAISIAVRQTSLVANTIDRLARVLGWISFVWSIAKSVSIAISVSSAFSWDTFVIDADRFGTALVVLVTSDGVALVLFFLGERFVSTSPGVGSSFAQAITIGSALDSDTLFVLAFGLGTTLSVRSASLGSIRVFVVALPGWVVVRVVVAKTAIGAVSVLGALLNNTLASFALADTISTFAWEVVLAGSVTKAFVVGAYVCVTDASVAAIALAKALNRLALGGVTSLRSAISMSWAVRVASAIDINANSVLTDLLISTMVSGSTFNNTALVVSASLDNTVWAGTVLAVSVVGAVDFSADLLLGEFVEVTNVLLVSDVDAIGSSSAWVLSFHLVDLEGEATAVTSVIRDESDDSSGTVGVPLEVPSLLSTSLLVWEDGIFHDHKWGFLAVGAAEDSWSQLFAHFRVWLNLDVVVTTVFSPVDVHLGELEGERVEVGIVCKNGPLEFFVVTVGIDLDDTTGVDVVILGLESKSLGFSSSSRGGSSSGFGSFGGSLGSGLGGFTLLKNIQLGSIWTMLI